MEEAARVLVSGIDSLVLALALQWPDDRAFLRLAELKESAKQRDDPEPLTVTIGEGAAEARFTIAPHGTKGFEWLLQSREVAMSLGNWLAPKQRPSAMVTLRSETLWTHGADAAVERAKWILEAMGASVESIKPSRLDLCVDVLLRESDWLPELDEHFVTRAQETCVYRRSRDVSGFTVGKGAVSARLYDKPREIREKSRKDWMFTIWGMPAVPEGHRIIRVEFQLRRDGLREWKIHAWDHVRAKLLGIWAYCTQRWLRVAVDARVHHTQQHLMPWWAVVQDGFRGAQAAEPLVREQAINSDRRRLAAQSIGTLSSIASLDLTDRDSTATTTLDQQSFLHQALAEAMDCASMGDAEFTRRIDRKRAKYGRSKSGFSASDATTRERPLESAGEPEEVPS